MGGDMQYVGRGRAGEMVGLGEEGDEDYSL